MRTWLGHGVAAASLGIAISISISAAPARAELDVHPNPSAPAGERLPDVSAGPEFDPLFDDDFDAALEVESDMESADPFENANRKIFDFNRGVSNFVFEPITRGYRFVVPAPARKGIRRVFLNLNSPRIFVNDLLQLRFRDAAETLGRFALNSTLGVGGLFDPAIEAGWERHDSDFGQTLGKMGVGSGPYLVVPIFGPSTVRDGFGSLVDLAMQPLAYILGPSELLLQIYIGSGNGLAALDAAHDKVEALEMSSVDFYAAMRSAYLQNRRAFVEEASQLDEAAAEEPLPPVGEPAADVEAEVRADRR